MVQAHGHVSAMRPHESNSGANRSAPCSFLFDATVIKANYFPEGLGRTSKDDEIIIAFNNTASIAPLYSEYFVQ
jgi:hypothetical protein